ncbi:hypothetical protein E9232_006358 [Inquilinus ginsengisoli]|uniref:Type IV secretion system family protein n=1 Tax=Inquilinus ginsengisoli TaxID=363840 RepID=A0ABU1K1U7_9PROT|nr:hypothetical protein [Inquilinus ginsengisoli]MDR6293805.1 hypothetical protein [Inquilinus ginsengisoli]
MQKVIILAAAVALATPTAVVHAAGVPTIDEIANGLNLQQLDQLRQQLQTLKDQFDQLAQQTAQAIQNAKRLGNLDWLMDELRQYSALLNTDAAKTVLQEFYGIQSTASNYEQLARQALGQLYDLPRTDDDIRQILSEAGASPAVVSSLTSNNGLLLDDEKAILQSTQSLNQSAEQSEKAKAALASKADALASLGDNDLAATAQLSTSVQIQQGYQLEQVTSELRAMRTEAVQRRLVELQAQKRELEAQLARQQELARIRADRHTPVSLDSFGQ